MSAQQFCLRWNNHQPNFVSVFAHLLKNETLVDVTLGAEGQHVQAHKVVLSACSSYFQQLFAVNPCQHPIVLLKDVKYADLKIVVDFMYCGEVNVTQDQLTSVLRTAEMLQIKGLAEIPEDSLPGVKARLSEQQGSSAESISQESVTHQLSWGSARSDTAGQSESFNESRRSPSPVSSPVVNRKRLRKNSTGSQSSSTERVTETSFEAVGSSPVIIKSESLASKYQDNGTASTRNESEDRSIDIASRDTSMESVEEDNQVPTVTRTDSQHESIKSSTSTQSSSSQGCQWQQMMGPPSGYTEPMMGPSSSGLMGPSNSDYYSSINQSPYMPYYNNPMQQAPVPNPMHMKQQPIKQQQQHHVSQPVRTPPPQVTQKVQLHQQQFKLSQQLQLNQLNQPVQLTQHVTITPQGQGELPGPKKKVPALALSENFNQALEAVRVGGITFSKAARIFGVNGRSLWLEYKKRGYPMKKPQRQKRNAGDDLVYGMVDNENDVIQVNCDDGKFEEFVSILENSIPVKEEPLDYPGDDMYDA